MNNGVYIVFEAVPYVGLPVMYVFPLALLKEIVWEFP